MNAQEQFRYDLTRAGLQWARSALVRKLIAERCLSFYRDSSTSAARVDWHLNPDGTSERAISDPNYADGEPFVTYYYKDGSLWEQHP